MAEIRSVPTMTTSNVSSNNNSNRYSNDEKYDDNDFNYEDVNMNMASMTLGNNNDSKTMSGKGMYNFSMVPGAFSGVQYLDNNTNNNNGSSNDNIHPLDQSAQVQVASTSNVNTETRSKRLKEEAIKRLVSDINRAATTALFTTTNNAPNPTNNTNTTNSNNSNVTDVGFNTPSHSQSFIDQQQLLIASTITTAIERNLDKELHTELYKQVKESASMISKICHDHSDTFLNSVAKVVELGPYCADIQEALLASNHELQSTTTNNSTPGGGGVAQFLQSTLQLEHAKLMEARARTMYAIVSACAKVALLLERARKQANLLRPRLALDAVDEARACLTTPLVHLLMLPSTTTTNNDNNATNTLDHSFNDSISSDFATEGLLNSLPMMDSTMISQSYYSLLLKEELSYSTDHTETASSNHDKDSTSKPNTNIDHSNTPSSTDAANNTPNPNSTTNNNNSTDTNHNNDISHQHHRITLEETPFGTRAMDLLPKIETAVLMGARRGLNRWFLSIRSGGDGAKAGRAALRKCAYSMSVGPGELGMGGNITKGYKMRAKNADNLIARVGQNKRIARAARMGYWFERDCSVEVERLETSFTMGVERRAEAFASAFGWYRCWEEGISLDVEEGKNVSGSMGDLNSSGHGGSRHGLNNSAHGTGGGALRASHHGRTSSLGFRAGASSSSGGKRSLSLTASNLSTSSSSARKDISKWTSALIPISLFEESSSTTQSEDEERLLTLPESVHPVRKAESAFALLGRTEEFRTYYEQNRFGDMKIGADKATKMMGDDGVGGGFEKSDVRSSLSSLTGDDVSQGTDRIFFSKSLPHLCANVVGFSAIEAALELGNFQEEEGSGNNSGGGANSTSMSNMNGSRLGSNKNKGDGKLSNTAESTQPSSFRESSARYERKLITELGSLLRNRAIGASLTELARASFLISSFRSALKVVHPISSTRKSDKELLAMDVDILMTGLKVAQEEQLRATSRIINNDKKEPMRVPKTLNFDKRGEDSATTNIPSHEVINFPFGLSELKLKSSEKNLDDIDNFGSRRSSLKYIQANNMETYNFSQSVPTILRTIHARAIVFASFASSQEELGQVFDFKKGGGIAGYVFDCVEECVKVSIIGMKECVQKEFDSLNIAEAVQLTVNISAIQSSLARLFGTLIRGMCHVGMIRADKVEEIFEYADKSLQSADKACDQQVASMFNVVYEICRNKLDSSINFCLENFNWVAKSTRETPNTYCESLIETLRGFFKCLEPMDEGSKAGLHFSICGHLAERLLDLIAGKVVKSKEDANAMDKNSQHGILAENPNKDNIRPINKIDAYGLKNLLLDIEEFETFALGTGVPQLKECFNELRYVTEAMLDVDLAMLVLPENENARRKKYPLLKLNLISNILEKYQGTGIGEKLIKSAGKDSSFLIMEKKDVVQLLKVVKSQLKE